MSRGGARRICVRHGIGPRGRGAVARPARPCGRVPRSGGARAAHTRSRGDGRAQRHDRPHDRRWKGRSRAGRGYAARHAVPPGEHDEARDDDRGPAALRAGALHDGHTASRDPAGVCRHTGVCRLRSGAPALRHAPPIAADSDEARVHAHVGHCLPPLRLSRERWLRRLGSRRRVLRPCAASRSGRGNQEDCVSPARARARCRLHVRHEHGRARPRHRGARRTILSALRAGGDLCAAWPARHLLRCPFGRVAASRDAVCPRAGGTHAVPPRHRSVPYASISSRGRRHLLEGRGDRDGDGRRRPR
jgi:hypothetical protein